MKNIQGRILVAFLLAVALPATAQLRAPPPPPPAPAPAPMTGGAPSGPAGGQQQADPLTREFRDCIQKAQTAMQAAKADDPAAIHVCLTAEIKRQDARLASATQKVVKLLPPEGKKRLDAANADWRRFRGSECGFLADENGPPPGNLENANCRLRMTTIRAVDLDGFATMLVRQEAATKAQQETPPAAAPAPVPAPAAAPPGKQ